MIVTENGCHVTLKELEVLAKEKSAKSTFYSDGRYGEITFDRVVDISSENKMPYHAIMFDEDGDPMW
jgi:hypothetical protein